MHAQAAPGTVGSPVRTTRTTVAQHIVDCADSASIRSRAVWPPPHPQPRSAGSLPADPVPQRRGTSMSTTTEAPHGATAPSPPAGGPRRRFWDRQLPHSPESGRRSLYLAITVLATVVLYYELYIAGAVGTQIIAEFGMSFTFFVFVSVV